MSWTSNSLLLYSKNAHYRFQSSRSLSAILNQLNSAKLHTLFLKDPYYVIFPKWSPSLRFSDKNFLTTVKISSLVRHCLELSIVGVAVT